MTEHETTDGSAMRYDSAPARRRSILTAVEESGFISVTELTRRLGVSDMTIRRDLRKLEHQGSVRVVHGGVSALQGPLHSAAFVSRASMQADGKRRIGEAAASLVRNDETIGVDAGTTAYAVVPALSESYSGITVTHSVPVMQLMLTRAVGRVVGLGGELLADSQAFVGPMTVEATRGLRIQTLFLGAAAADDHGIYVVTDNERPTKLALMGISQRVVLVVDATKFAAHAPVHLGDWSGINTVITDGAPPAATAAALREAAVDVRIV